MTKRRKPKDSVQTTIKGNVSGQIAIGNDINQSKTKIHQDVTSEELDTLRQLINELRTKIIAVADSEMKDAALERVDELEQAVTEEKPDLTTMEYVKKWFGKKLPALAGAVTSVVVHPIVGKLVEAGGDLLVKEFQEKFGGDP